jgi:hypothetical protein
LGKERLGGGAHQKGADGGGARTKSNMDDGSPVLGAGEADAWGGGEVGEELELARGQEDKKGGRRGRVHVEAREEGERRPCIVIGSAGQSIVAPDR